MNFKDNSFHDQTDHFGASFTASGNASCDHTFVIFLFLCFLKAFMLYFFFSPGDDVLTNEQCFNQKDSNEINVRMLY